MFYKQENLKYERKLLWDILGGFFLSCLKPTMFHFMTHYKDAEKSSKENIFNCPNMLTTTNNKKYV